MTIVQNTLNFVVLLVVVSGCSSPTQYKVRNAAKGQLTWGYNSSLEAQKDGRTVASEKGKWKGLAEAVDCVPKSKPLALAARKNKRSGAALQAVGAAIMVTTFVGGVAMMLTGALRDHGDGTAFNDPLFWGGMGTTVIGPIGIGMPMVYGGGKKQIQGRADAIDSFYIYNDSYQETAACGYVSPAPPPAPTPRAAAGNRHAACSGVCVRTISGGATERGGRRPGGSVSRNSCANGIG